MAVNLSIKNVPDTLAAKLRQRAEANHRSLQGELMALLEANVAEDRQERAAPANTGSAVISSRKSSHADAPRRSLAEISAVLRKIFPIVATLPPGTSSVEIVRRARDMRDGSQWKDPSHHKKGY